MTDTTFHTAPDLPQRLRKDDRAAAANADRSRPASREAG